MNAISELAAATIAEITSDAASPIIASASEDSLKENNSINENATTSSSQPIETKSQSTSNAFEFMMTARYKSIGTNSPGKELPNNKDIKTPDINREINVKRKLMLEEWADRKGRAKKRQNEAADDEYIDMVMEKRTKRLRTLLKNGTKEKEIKISDEETVPTKPKSNGFKVKLTKRKNRIEDSEEDDDFNENQNQKSNSSSRLRNGKKKKNETNFVPDENFCENLSSPLKKRDSLLGYFSKLTKTPSDNVPLNTTASDNIPNKANETPENKKRTKNGRRPKKTSPVEEILNKKSLGFVTDDNIQKTVVEVVDKVSDDHQHKIITSLLSTSESSKPLSEGRPKRLCRDKKISYLIDEDYTPTRSREKKVSGKEQGTPKPTAKQSKPTKLAPIFAKATPKPVVDPIALLARHEFLMSGIPEKMKLEIEKQRQFEEFYETEYEVFPKISHVGHCTKSSNVDVNLTLMNIRFQSEVEEDENIKHSSELSCIMKIQKSDSDGAVHSDSIGKHKTMDQKELMRQLKQNDTAEFPFYRCFKQLKRKNAFDLTEEDDDCDNSIEFVVEKVASANGSELFTEKYRPESSSEVILNTKPLIELQKFLSSWKENMDGREDGDSSDEFETNSNSGMSSINKAIVLTGPAGCGKTLFVYALANEMNFKVLEINAGAKRTGKKVLQKLQEATQSHHVNNNQCSQSDRSKNVKSRSNQSEDSEESGATQKLSLILIEDAEVVFSEDFGFIESINQLVQTTKRPVILITNQINCPHLSRFINRNMISFRLPTSTIASKWLSTLSVAEQCYVSEAQCRALYQRNNCDFRKTLLELQFFIQSTNRMSDKNSTSVVCTDTELRDLFFKDQNREEKMVPFPIDFTKLSSNTKQILNSPQTGNDNSDGQSTKVKSNSLNETVDFLNFISTAQWFEQKTDSSDRIKNHLSDDISHFMVEESIKIRSRNWSDYEETIFDLSSMSK